MHKKLSQAGFSVIESLFVIVVLVVVSLSGWLAWRHAHKQKTPVGSTTIGSQQTKQSGTSGPSSTTDVYAGWKTFCDTTYKYCFKYPNEWTLALQQSIQQKGFTQISITSPDGAVSVSYINPNSRDHETSQLTVADVESLPGTAHDVSIVGGYIPYGTGYLPIYNVADGAVLEKYPVTVGKTVDFPTTASFTDLSGNSIGSFFVQSTQQLNSTAAAKAWFASADATTGLLILKSLHNSTN